MTVIFTLRTSITFVTEIHQQGNLLFNDYPYMQMQLVRSLFQQMYFINVLHTN